MFVLSTNRGIPYGLSIGTKIDYLDGDNYVCRVLKPTFVKSINQRDDERRL